MLFYVVGWLLVGLIAGVLARKVTPGVRSGGIFVDTLTGLLGSFIGGALGWFFPILNALWGIPAAFVGAVILLYFLKRSASRMVR